MKIKVTVLDFRSHLYNYVMLSLSDSWVETLLYLYNLTLCEYLSPSSPSTVQNSIWIENLLLQGDNTLDFLRPVLSNFMQTQANK